MPPTRWVTFEWFLFVRLVRWSLLVVPTKFLFVGSIDLIRKFLIAGFVGLLIGRENKPQTPFDGRTSPANGTVLTRGGLPGKFPKDLQTN